MWEWLKRFRDPWRWTVLPQELVEKLNDAEQKLQVALDKDQEHDVARVALEAAQMRETDTANQALEAHMEANSAAMDAVNAVKEHFGIS